MNPLLDARPRTDQDPPGSFSARESKKRAAFAALIDDGGFLDECPCCGQSLAGQYIFHHVQMAGDDELEQLAIFAAFNGSKFSSTEGDFLYELSLLHHGE